MPDQKFDFSVFTHPKVLYTELYLTPRGGERPRAVTDTNDLKTSRDFLIDFIWIGNTGGYGMSAPGAVYQDFSQFLWVNWQIADRAPFVPQGEAPAYALQTWWDSDRQLFMGTGPSFVCPSGVLFWRHTLRWIYNPAQSFRVDYELPTTTNYQNFNLFDPPGRRKSLGAALHGVGLRTGHRRVFGLGDRLLLAPNPGQPTVSGSITNPSLATNISDEPYLIEGFGIVLDDAWWNGDSRWLNYVRVKVVPTQGDAWSDRPVPLAAYGVNTGTPQRSIFYKPPGGPILMKAGQSMLFTLANANPDDGILAQVALIGRVAPGYGSLY